MFGDKSTPAFGQQPAANPFGTQQPQGGGMFGSSQPPQQQGGLFGASQPGGGLFGASQPPPQQGGGLFGASQPQQQGGGGGLFGASQPPPQQGGGLFGASQPQQQQQGGGLFGSSQPQQGGGLFGSSQPQQQQQGGLFGSSQPPQQPQQGGGLFGSSQSQGGGLFGSSQSQGGGLFGSSQSQGGGLFGSSQPQQGGGLFGSSQPQGGLFGSSQPQGGLFGGGQAQPQQAPFSIFGGNTNPQQPQQTSPMDLALQHANVSGPNWYRELVGIQAAFRVCRYSKFQALVYETLPPHISKSDRQRLFFANLPWLEEREWQRMEDSNPDQTVFGPYPLIGANMLELRLKKQEEFAQRQLDQNLTWIDLSERNLQVLSERVKSSRRKFQDLQSRMIACLGRFERLQARNQTSGPRTPKELAFKNEMSQLRERLGHPQTGLLARVLHLEAILPPSPPLDNTEEKEESKLVVEREEDRVIMAFLEEQSLLLKQVMDTLKRDVKEMALLKQRMNLL